MGLCRVRTVRTGGSRCRADRAAGSQDGDALTGGCAGRECRRLCGSATTTQSATSTRGSRTPRSQTLGPSSPRCTSSWYGASLVGTARDYDTIHVCVYYRIELCVPCSVCESPIITPMSAMQDYADAGSVASATGVGTPRPRYLSNDDVWAYFIDAALGLHHLHSKVGMHLSPAASRRRRPCVCVCVRALRQ